MWSYREKSLTGTSSSPASVSACQAFRRGAALARSSVAVAARPVGLGHLLQLTVGTHSRVAQDGGAGVCHGCLLESGPTGQVESPSRLSNREDDRTASMAEDFHPSSVDLGQQAGVEDGRGRSVLTDAASVEQDEALRVLRRQCQVVQCRAR